MAKICNIFNICIQLCIYIPQICKTPVSGNAIGKEDVKRMNNAGRIKRNLVDPIQKDTMPVPDGGFSIMRFKADNPGFWILHCHMSWHHHVGMAVILQVSCRPHHQLNLPNFTL